VAAVLLAFALAVWVPGSALAQASIVDTQLEVSTAVAQSSITTEAIKKADDTKCRAYQARIDTLTGQVKAGKAQRADLVAAREALIGRLGEIDTAYKAEIASFRGAVTDIASTPEGLTALARYNAGDQAGALAILDKLQAADEAARQKATDIQRAVGERHIAELASDARDKGKVTTASVIARYEGVVKLDPSVFSDWIYVAGLYADAGRTSDAQHAAETAAKVASNDRDRSIALEELGDVQSAQGNTAGAGKAYAEGLVIFRRLAAAQPTNVSAQRAVAVAVERTGDVLQAEGDLAGAGRAYAEGLAISRRLAAADPTNAGRQRDVSVGLQGTGEVLQAQGDLAGAGHAYAEDLAISRRLAAADPTNADAQRGVSVTLDKTGEVLQAQGDLAGAGKAYAEALSIDRRLAAADPTNAGAQRDVAIALDRTGEALRAKGDLAGAVKAYAEALAIGRRVAAADPANAGAQRDLSGDLANVGDVLRAAGDLAGAGKAYAEELAIRHRLAAADRANADAQRDVWVVMFKLASIGTPGVRWSDVVSWMKAMDAKGMLAPSDRQFLDQARASAATAAGK
jgi:tetratricopeptide (TPR) repeat protein